MDLSEQLIMVILKKKKRCLIRPCRATFFSQINSRACTAIRHYIVLEPRLAPMPTYRNYGFSSTKCDSFILFTEAKTAGVPSNILTHIKFNSCSINFVGRPVGAHLATFGHPQCCHLAITFHTVFYFHSIAVPLLCGVDVRRLIIIHTPPFPTVPSSLYPTIFFLSFHSSSSLPFHPSYVVLSSPTYHLILRSCRSTFFDISHSFAASLIYSFIYYPVNVCHSAHAW